MKWCHQLTHLMFESAQAIMPIANAILGLMVKPTRIVCITIGNIPIPPGVRTIAKEPKNKQTKADTKGKSDVSGSAK
jgi:hypothetical protein